MAKRKMSENSLKNLEKGNLANKTPSERKEIARKGAAKTNQIRAEKRKRENMLPDLFKLLDEAGIIDGSIEAIANEVQKGNVKNALELLKLVKPNELQQQQIMGSLAVQKIFITQKEQQETDEHIDNVINEQ